MANKCPHAVGAKTGTVIAWEETYGVMPADVATSGIRLPFNSNAVVSSQSATDPATIRADRNPVEAIYGNHDVNGEMVNPTDYTAIGHMLKAAFGEPTTTSSDGKYQHIFTVKDNIPSFTMEKTFAGIGQFIRTTGCKVNEIAFSFGGDGELTFSNNIMGAKETVEASAMCPNAVEAKMNRINNTHLSAKVDGVDTTAINKFDFRFSNNLDGDKFPIGSEGYRKAACEGLATASGSIEAYFEDATFLEKAEQNITTSMELIAAYGEDYSLSILLPELKFAKNSPAIDGPAGVMLNLNYNAFFKDNAQKSAVVITLINDVESY